MGERVVVGPTPRTAHRGDKTFTRGAGEHRSISWFAIGWLATNLRHLLASQFAVDDIDARDWMTPDEPKDLLARIASTLGARHVADTLTDTLGRDVWIDYIADTGDDDTVSKAVAKMVTQDYEVELDGRKLVAPRGDLLCFGGDTAYPVATAAQIRARLVDPWEEVLAGRDDGKQRAILGIPGNHDWNDGLDGFGRLFRRRDERVEIGERKVTPDRPKKEKPPAGPLALPGYAPVQSASYFNLPLAPGIDLWGVDRQLRHVDHRQRQFFARTGARDPSRKRILMQSDPHRVFGKENAPGAQVTERLGVKLLEEPHLVLAGDIHQYERWQRGASMHVTAGGGGAALHGAIAGADDEPAFPTESECRPLLRETAARIITGKAGWFIHAAIGLATLLVTAMLACPLDRAGLFASAAVLFLAAVIGARKAFGRGATFPAILLGAAVAATPAALGWLYPPVLLFAGDVAPVLLSAIGAAVLGGTMAGICVWLLAVMKVENHLAWAALGHPGYKHFVRMRIRADGSRIDAWCFGLRDPCRPREPVLLVDHFHFPVA